MRTIPAHDPSAVPEAVSALRQGLLIIYPTDTAYALGADCLQSAALALVQQVKNRQTPKPLPLIVADLAQVERIAKITTRERRAAEQYWPGPLTMLLKALPTLPEAVALGHDRVAVRVPNEPLARQLARMLGRPIVATSANRTGAGATYDPALIHSLFDSTDDIALFINAGRLPVVPPSTIIELVGTTFMTRRPGPVIVQ